MSEFAADWLGQIQTYFQEYGCWFVLIVLFLKNLTLVGTIVPGTMVTVAAGWYARQGHGSFALFLLSAIVGSIAGDIVSYFVGKKSGGWLLRSKRWGEPIGALLQRVRNEPILFVFCHFEAVLRACVPTAAGMSRVPLPRWLLLNAIGEVLWVACYMTAGYFLSIAGAMAAGKSVALYVVGGLILLVAGRYLHGKMTRKPEGNNPVVTSPEQTQP